MMSPVSMSDVGPTLPHLRMYFLKLWFAKYFAVNVINIMFTRRFNVVEQLHVTLSKS